MNDEDLPLDDLLDPDTTHVEPHALPLKPAHVTLAPFLIGASVSSGQLRRISTSRALVVVVRAPSAAWVTPLEKAMRGLADWDLVETRESSSRRPPDSHALNQLVRRMSLGGRVLGIAPNPEKDLPAVMAGAADIRIELGHPGRGVLAKAIRSATGVLPRRMPADIGVGLDFPDLAAAIRIRTTAGACVGRLTNSSKRLKSTVQGTPEPPELSTLHGYGEAMEWAKRLLSGLEEYRAGRIPFSALDRKVVLGSKPGLGKTTFVASFAKAAGLPLVATSVAQWFSESSGYLDGMIKRVDAVMAEASANAPAILFIDELDALPGRQNVGDRNRDYWVPLITQFLTALDGLSSGQTAKLIVVGATNYLDRIDSALIRPGRLRPILIAPPTPADLAGIVRSHLRTDLPHVDLKRLGRLLAGRTGAFAADLVRRARERAAHARRPLAEADLMREMLPDERRPQDVVRRSALHEAAHAVAALVLGCGTLDSVSIMAEDGEGGRTTVSGDAHGVYTRGDMEARVVMALAGRAMDAQEDCATTGAGGGRDSDLAYATRIVAALHSSVGLAGKLLWRGEMPDMEGVLAGDEALRNVVESDLRRYLDQAAGLVAKHRGVIVAVADLLVRERIVGGDEIQRIVLEATGSGTAPSVQAPRADGAGRPR